MKIEKEVVGDRIRTLMEDKGVTIYDLAELTHLSAATISRYVNGLMSPKITTIEIIATRYGVNPAWLMGMSDKKALPANAVKLQSARIPLLGTIAAGKPILAEENIEEYIDVDTLTKADFCLVSIYLKTAKNKKKQFRKINDLIEVTENENQIKRNINKLFF